MGATDRATALRTRLAAGPGTARSLSPAGPPASALAAAVVLASALALTAAIAVCSVVVRVLGHGETLEAIWWLAGSRRPVAPPLTVWGAGPPRCARRHDARRRARAGDDGRRRPARARAHARTRPHGGSAPATLAARGAGAARAARGRCTPSARLPGSSPRVLPAARPERLRDRRPALAGGRCSASESLLPGLVARPGRASSASSPPALAVAPGARRPAATARRQGLGCASRSRVLVPPCCSHCSHGTCRFQSLHPATRTSSSAP